MRIALCSFLTPWIQSLLYIKSVLSNTGNTIPVSIMDYYTADIDIYSDDDQEDTTAATKENHSSIKDRKAIED